VGNPAEETYCYPNNYIVKEATHFCQPRNFTGIGGQKPPFVGFLVALQVAFPTAIQATPNRADSRRSISPLHLPG